MILVYLRVILGNQLETTRSMLLNADNPIVNISHRFAILIQSVNQTRPEH
jgi:hypothetical protein